MYSLVISYNQLFGFKLETPESGPVGKGWVWVWMW